jgi:hypothetical protein
MPMDISAIAAHFQTDLFDVTSESTHFHYLFVTQMELVSVWLEQCYDNTPCLFYFLSGKKLANPSQNKKPPYRSTQS